MDFQVMLAPIEDYTEYPFRELCRRHGASFTFVPLVPAKAVVRNPDELEKFGIVREEERTAVQLFGDSASDFFRAAEIIDDWAGHQHFDINCGCPSPRVRGSGAGSMLLNMPEVVEEIVRLIKEGGWKVSVKMRLHRRLEKTFDFVDRIIDAGVDMITLHGRTVAQGYSGRADWNAIKEVYEFIRRKREEEGRKVLFVGNGDITSLNECYSRKGVYADGFMIGRVALSNPVVFEGRSPDFEERIELMREFISICRSERTPRRGNVLNSVKLVLLRLASGFDNAAALRNRIASVKHSDDFELSLDEYLRIVDCF